MGLFASVLDEPIATRVSPLRTFFNSLGTIEREELTQAIVVGKNGNRLGAVRLSAIIADVTGEKFSVRQCERFIAHLRSTTEVK